MSSAHPHHQPSELPRPDQADGDRPGDSSPILSEEVASRLALAADFDPSGSLLEGGPAHADDPLRDRGPDGITEEALVMADAPSEPSQSSDRRLPPITSTPTTNRRDFLKGFGALLGAGVAGGGISALLFRSKGGDNAMTPTESAATIESSTPVDESESYSYVPDRLRVTDPTDPFTEMASFTTKGRSPEQLALLEELKKWGYPAKLVDIDHFDMTAEGIIFTLFEGALFPLTNTKDPQMLAEFMSRTYPLPPNGIYDLDYINRALERVMRAPTEPFKRFEIPSLKIYSDKILENGRRRITFELEKISFFNPETDIETVTPEFAESSQKEHGSSVEMVTSLGSYRTTAVTFGRDADGRIVIYELPEF